MRHTLSALLLTLAPAVLGAQTVTQPAPLAESAQVAMAVLPLPAEFRANATVLGYRAGTAGLVTLRKGSGPFVCLASDPAGEQLHVACYHESLEPFMARGRALRAQGVKGTLVDSARFRDVRAGTLRMPKQPAALYSLTGPAGSLDPVTGSTKGAGALYVVYIPGATAASTGISATPSHTAPWIMYPGTPKAHIMFAHGM